MKDELFYTTDDQVSFAREDGYQYIVGYASVFYDGTPRTEYSPYKGVKVRIDRHAFDKSVANGDDVIGVYNHDKNQLLGRTSSGTMKIQTTDKGLLYKIRFDASDPTHQSVRAKIERKDIKGSSFQMSATEGRVEKWSSEGDNDIRTITGVKLKDCGPVNDPAFSEAGTAMFCLDSAEETRASHERWKAQQETDKRIEKAKSIQ
jgi:hypothetical protein